MSIFTTSDKPVITGMIKSDVTSDVIAEVARLKDEGVEAFGIQLDHMKLDSRSDDDIRRIFDAMKPLPIYATCYKKSNKDTAITWEQIEERLLFMASAGAAIVDIPADMYNSSDMEFTEDADAVEKQKDLIRRIHAAGAEVLMSCHILKFTPMETVMHIATAQKERGADVAKMVTGASTQEELYANFEINLALMRKFGNKTLFLCGGEKNRMHRLLGPLFGSCMFLVTENALTQAQPKVCLAKESLKYLD